MTRREIYERIAAKDPRYKPLAPGDDHARASDRPTPPAPCIHVGLPVFGPDAPDLVRGWHRCDHPRRIALAIAEVVCPCRGCKPGCPGYET